MISSKYLQAEKVKEVYAQGKGQSPIQYFVWEDFIDPKVYSHIEQEIQKQEYKILDTHRDAERRVNKTVALEWEYLAQLFRFFESQELEKYLSLFLWYQVRQEFYIGEEEIKKVLWEEFKWAIAQIYEKWDLFDWHIDGPIEEGSLGAFTYYLWGYDGEWNLEDGGNLEFGVLTDTWQKRAYHTVPYKKNTLVFICGTHDAHHRVTKVNANKLRLSIQSTILRK